MSGEKLVYHCSPTAGIRVLEPNVTKYFGKPRQVCLTVSLPMALFYGIKHFEYTYGYTREGAIYYMEYFSNALEKLYRGKTASLYRCIRRPDMEETDIPNELITALSVPVAEEMVVPDVWEALLEQERMGALRIIRWPEVNTETREWILRAERDTIVEKGLLHADTPFARYMREIYPESWALAAEEEQS